MTRANPSNALANSTLDCGTIDLNVLLTPVEKLSGPAMGTSFRRLGCVLWGLTPGVAPFVFVKGGKCLLSLNKAALTL